MTREEITKFAKEFSEPFKDTIGGINGSGWLIVDPLSACLSSIGIKHECMEMPEKKGVHPQVLILKFPDGSQFIPAGGDLKKLSDKFENWMWT